MQLVDKYRPRELDGFVGLANVKCMMGGLVSNPGESAWLFHGDPGLGKSEMAEVVAATIGLEPLRVPSCECTVEAIREIGRWCRYVPMWGKKFHGVLIDEADSMTNRAQDALLSLLAGRERLKDTIFLLTCNEPKKLETRFRGRCQDVPFTNYGMAQELEARLRDIWVAELAENPTRFAGKLQPNFQRLVKDSGTNPRRAMMTLDQIMLT